MASVNLGSIKFNWKGAYNSSTAYVVDDVVSLSGSSYICIQNNSGQTPTNTSFWNIMAQAGAEGGAISSMSDTVISSSLSDGSILQYDNSASKWKDTTVFGGTFASPSLDGGTF